ncbi:hypothetical protein T4A_1425 [Trichinella pseudospiralis]|uniref:Uncharacterized protein n=1 Tax=Trichinella pseudospiralis TaxID=6337 RepID=A0A0V1DUT3_TRIPS|nr:hypothetical protein T4A_1425 [Trichinella pseudospiralis]KRY86629.1 hypothetical protein T4D_16724 [Trichinella pseudospiralis]KRZ23752.1 hypothetical protein T4C_742 [Trichinella pseudospiralis]KRZ26291.1 hypothetical protein T4C_12123 [Trichinella pseudospiralis]
MRTDSSGCRVVEIIAFADTDVCEPEIDSENEHESKSDENVDDSTVSDVPDDSDDEERSRSSDVWTK